jgi:hypothetical protein
MSEGTTPEDAGREERLTTGPAPRTDLTTGPAGPTSPARGGEEICLPCGRCRRESPVSELGRLWWLPGLLWVPFWGAPRNEVQGLYCAACRRRLNWCLTFLAAMFALWLLTLLLPRPRP